MKPWNVTYTPAELAYQRARWHEDRGPQLAAIIIAMFSLTTLAVISRLLSNRLAKRRLFLDDWAILLALVGCSASQQSLPRAESSSLLYYPDVSMLSSRWVVQVVETDVRTGAALHRRSSPLGL